MTLPIHEICSNWPVRCSQFSHGWLRNRFCQSLKATIQVAAGKVGRDSDGDVHLVLMQDWLDHEESAGLLISEFPKEMTPASLFAYLPLSRFEPEVASFFRDMAHSHWLQRHHIETRLVAAKDALALAGAQVRKLRDARSSQDAVELGLVASIHDACLRLAEALSQLPRAIIL